MTYQEIIKRIKKMKSNLGLTNKRKPTPEILLLIKQKKKEYSSNQENKLETTFCDFILKENTLSTSQFLNKLKAKKKEQKQSSDFIQKVINNIPLDKLSDMPNYKIKEWTYKYVIHCKDLTDNLHQKELMAILFNLICIKVNNNNINSIKEIDLQEVNAKYKSYLSYQHDKKLAEFNLLCFPYSLLINAEYLSDEYDESNQYDISCQILKAKDDGFSDSVIKERHFGIIDESQLSSYKLNFNQFSDLLNSTMNKYVSVLPDNLSIGSNS